MKIEQMRVQQRAHDILRNDKQADPREKARPAE
jgi:hypothetical protein